MAQPPQTGTERSRSAAVWHYARWAIFYFGLMLSPLALWNDPLLNQLPSAVTATFLIRNGVVTGISYGTLYIVCYIATNVLGFLLMLVNVRLLRERWNKLHRLRRENLPRFIASIVLDVATFVALYFLGRFAVSLT